MFDPYRIHRVWSALLLGSFVAVFFVIPGTLCGAQNSSARAPKLTTPLADLAQTVPQEQGEVVKRRLAPPAGFSIDSMPKSARDAVTTGRMRMNAYGEVQVYVLLTVFTDDMVKQLQAAGVTVELENRPQRLVQGEIPVSRLAQVSALPFVQFIRLPAYARHHAGSVDTEGDAIIHADQVRTQLGVDGTGVRVAAISDGLKGVFATGCTSCSGASGGPISTGDLPSATGTRNAAGVLTSSTGGINGQTFDTASQDLEGQAQLPPNCGFPGAGAEGTALLEIIHDIAPGAQLSFANFATDQEFLQAVNTMAANNDVVVDDIGFFGGPYDGTSAVSLNTSNALNSASNSIRTYITAVGNAADGHYLGLFTDSGVDGSTIATATGHLPAGHLHLFQASADGTTVDTLGTGPQTFNRIKLPFGGEVVLFLDWDDTFGSSANDYDLYLVQEGTNTVVAGSANRSCLGTTNPVECLDYVNTGLQGFFDIVIQNPGNSAAPKNLNLFAFTPECAHAGLASLGPSHAKVNFNTASHSVISESDAGGGVISVGAICSASAKAQATLAGSAFPDVSCNDTTNSTIEFFSSIGPTFDARLKPDIVAIDGVSVTGAGSFENPFFGSSAAAPHVAGEAALLLQAKSCLLSGVSGALNATTARDDIYNLILVNAYPLPDLSSSPNSTFGWGLADALASASQTAAVFNGPSSFVVPGNVPGGASLRAWDIGFAPAPFSTSPPQTCPMATLSWTGGCGTGPASSMTCPFGTSNVSVMASNGSALFSAAAAVSITVTNFSLGESPSSNTVAAGQSATYQVTLTSQGGVYGASIKLACSNLPAATTCSFSPAQVTPGSASAQSTLTVTTTARSLVPPDNNTPSIRLPRLAPSARSPLSLPYFVFGAAGAAAAMLWAWLILWQMPISLRRRYGALGAAVVALAFIAALAACGGGGSSPPPPPSGTPAGNYTISISGTSGTLVQSANATLVVQ